jgi:hypothetical protein
MAQSSIIVCFALKEEAAPFRKIARAAAPENSPAL